MPIVNGKYKNPGWVNNQPPRINATELNAISDTLEGLDAGGSGGGKRYASVVVGTSANGWTAADCDYLCDGTDDQVEIQQAVNSLPDTGGQIYFLAGTYHISEAVERGGKNIAFQGGGFAVWACPATEALLISNGLSAEVSCVLDGIKFNGPTGAYIKFNCAAIEIKNCVFSNVFVEAGAGTSTTVESFSFHNNIMHFSAYSGISSAIRYQGNALASEPASAQIKDNVFLFTNQESIAGNSFTEFNACTVNFSGNYCEGDTRSVRFYFPQGEITGNYFGNQSVMLVENGAISGNTVENGDIFVGGTHGLSISCTGNHLETGSIQAMGATSVVGNIVIDPANTYGIQVASGGINQKGQFNPLVSGNIVCQGTKKTGSVGISLIDNAYPQTTKGSLITGNKIYNFPTPIQIASTWQNTMVTNNLFDSGTIQDNGAGNIVRGNSDDTST